MVDARIPERYLVDRRVMRLSPSAFRSFVCGLVWSVSNRTDGQIGTEDVEDMAGVLAIDVAEIVASGLWTHLDGGFLIADFAATQTSASELTVLENNRRRDRLKKARQRAERAAVPGDMSPGTAQAPLGQAINKEEPALFCADHPAGANGDPCSACGDARRVHEAWERRMRDRVGATPHRRADPATCQHRRHPVDPVCLDCDTVLELTPA